MEKKKKKTLTKRCTESGEFCCIVNGEWKGCYKPANCQKCVDYAPYVIYEFDIPDKCQECKYTFPLVVPLTGSVHSYCKSWQGCCNGICFDPGCEQCDPETKTITKKSNCPACCKPYDRTGNLFGFVFEQSGPGICYNPSNCEKCDNSVSNTANIILHDAECELCNNGKIEPRCPPGTWCCGSCGNVPSHEGRCCYYCEKCVNGQLIGDSNICDYGEICCDDICRDPQANKCKDCINNVWTDKCKDNKNGETSCCDGICYDPEGCKQCQTLSSGIQILVNKTQDGFVCCNDVRTNISKFVPENKCCGLIISQKIIGEDEGCCGNEIYEKRNGEYDCCNGILDEVYKIKDKTCCRSSNNNSLDTLIDNPNEKGCCNGQVYDKSYQDCCNNTDIFEKLCQVCISNKIYDKYAKNCYDCNKYAGYLTPTYPIGQDCCIKDDWSHYGDGKPGEGPYDVACDQCDTNTGKITKRCKDTNKPDCCFNKEDPKKSECWNSKSEPCWDCINGELTTDKCKNRTDEKTKPCPYTQNGEKKCDCYKPGGCDMCDSTLGVIRKDCAAPTVSDQPIIYTQDTGGNALPYYGVILKDSCCSSSGLTGVCYSSVCEDCLNDTVLTKKTECSSCCNNQCCKTTCCEISQNEFLCCDDKGPNPDCCVFENGNKDCCKTGKCCPGDNKCCSDSEDCTNGKCCPIGEIAYGPDKICCLPEKWCASTNTCCSGEQICCDGACVDPKECCNGIRCPSGEVCCGSSGCVPSNECCGNKPFDPTGCQKCVNDTPIDDCPFVNGVRLPCCQGTNGSPGQCYDPNNCEKCSSGVKVPYVPSNPDCYCLNGTEICNCIIVPLTWSFDEACSYCVNYGSGSISSSNGNVWDLNGMSSSFTSPYSYPGNMMITVNCSDGNDYIVWTGTSVPNGTLTGIPTSLPSNPCCP